MPTPHALNISAAAPMISNRIECGAQIGDEVAGIFYADGNSDQSIGNAEALARLLGDAGMRRACGMRYQGFGASQTYRELDHLQRIEQTKRLRLSALDREAERGARTLTLPLEHRVPRIIGG